MAIFVITHKGTITVGAVDTDWATYPHEYLNLHPKARLYRRMYLMDLIIEYRLDRASRHPRKVRRTHLDLHELPAEIKASLLINPDLFIGS